MKKYLKKIFSDWVVGVFLTLVILAGYLLNWYPLEALENKTYDFRARLLQREVESPVVIVAIDDGSIKNIGRWPWPRRYMASIIDNLSSYGARVIGVNILFTEAVVDPGQAEIRAIGEGIEQMPGYEKNADLMTVYYSLQKAERTLDNDGKLAGSMEFSENVVLPLYFTLGEKMDTFKVEFADYALDNSIEVPEGTGAVSSVAMVAPIPEFSSVAYGLGHTNVTGDQDGGVRREPLLIQYGNRLFPSFGLLLAMKYLNFGPSDLDLSDGVNFGKIHIPTDGQKRMLIRYNGKSYSFPYFSFSSVLSEMVPAEEFEDKIVLIGTVGTGIGSFEVTPIEANFPPVEIVANVIENILSRDFITRPGWAYYAEIAAIVLFGLFLAFLLPRVKAGLSALIALLLLVAWNGAAVYLFAYRGMWIMMMHPTLLLVLGYTIMVSKRFMVTERKKELVETDSIETNKMLGLSFQGQGLLDMALDKFMKCPIEDQTVKEHMYNLALDFERKRMFNKAVSVYKHVLTAGKFKDIEERINKLTIVGETMIFGAAGARKDATVLMEGASMTPTLGRYEVQKELGRGAMGTVFLGKDPKINREVAIKTVRFDEVDEGQIADVKERFFREAEAAGRLSHPNIVTIFDAGEDYEVAYVAMELLDGMDLSEYLEKLGGKRMPLKLAMRITASVADALEYAHKSGVVHRDIKPANIMLLKKGTVKVTDFGIARVIATSKTQTGVVLGTPSYMSPEQVVGKKVDGRSDIFSLGVMFYELISGQKPFTGDGIATLMYNIANQPHPPIKELVPGLPDCCVAIVNRILEKDAEKRYQFGREVVRDIKMCFKAVG